MKVRIDEFFGGHAAVLGNTGSGKSCTVASILQELFDKPEEHHARGATFVVLDVNGEYHQAFGGLIGQAFTVVIHRNAGVAPWHAGENLQLQLGQGDVGSEQGVFLGERVFLAHIDQRQFFMGQ
ncbi:helicase HerA domain-containing protein, partial [Kocuria rosea]|uniref:helicase HerA domain-containing protein n=1 Tax=Kocuria rosea TaxID=1275 RepID=UPI002B2400B4